MKRKTDMTSERIFFGALVNAYSRPVIDAKISLIAISMYLRAYESLQTVKNRRYLRAALCPHIDSRNVGSDA